MKARHDRHLAHGSLTDLKPDDSYFLMKIRGMNFGTSFW